jgi:hypothetical protein
MSNQQNDTFEEEMKESADEALDRAQMGADDAKDQDLPEAPTSMTMKVWIKGYGVMITARDNKMNSLLKKTETLIDYAVSHGWKNVWDTAPQATSKPATSQAHQGDVPMCGVHGTPMKWITGKYKTTTPYHEAGDDFAFWSCGKKNADNSYCNYKVPKKEPVKEDYMPNAGN